jgi:cytochrome c oxidase subunit 3
MTDQKSGLMAALAGVTMLFAAFTSAYIVRRGLSADWVSLKAPVLAYASLAPLVGISVALGSARRRGAAGFLTAGVVLGSLVCVMQLYAWRQFKDVGPAPAFFFVISGAFLVFVAGGVAALLHLLLRGAPTESTIATHFYYWVYLSVLWMYLLVYFSFWK